MPTPPIRTITLGIAEPHPIPSTVIRRSNTILKQVAERFNEAGYEVQTMRLSTRPLLHDLANWSPSAIMNYVKELQALLDDVGLGFCSLGTVDAVRSDFPLERLDLLADLLITSSAFSATVQFASLEGKLRAEAALPTARIIERLARETTEGFGNFRFAMLAHVAPGHPFFPAAYHAGPASLSIGLQGAGMIAEALRAHQPPPEGGHALTQIAEWVSKALIKHVSPVQSLLLQLTRQQDLLYGGIDLSPAPLGEDSIVSALELCGYGLFGSPGTLAVAATLIQALKSSELSTCGYCGLMLPVLEDAILGQRWAEGMVNVHQLLLYSAVCGTGLDTIPLPGDCSTEKIAHLLLDVASLAQRLHKPLSARLFPVPEKRAGELTNFSSPYLTNTRIQLI
jgi:uncharacterized protein (UPF0210 family)